jgi:hypothetical protein
MSDYSKWGKAYYQAHRDTILAAEKDKKRWLDYYQKNKEEIAERNRRRYYEKKGLPVPEKGAPREASKPGRPQAPNNELVERFEKLVAELRELAPQVVKPKKVKKAKKAKTPDQAPMPDLPASPPSQVEEEAPVNAIEWVSEIVDPAVTEGEVPGGI